MTRIRLPMVALAVMAIALSACGGGASATPEPTATPVPATAAPSPTEDAFAKQWDALVAAAKAEGELVIVSGPEGVQDDGDWYKAFQDEYGIKVTVYGGATAEVTARVEAERAQGVYSFDVGSLGGSGTRNMLKDEFFDQLDPLLINPEVLDRTNFGIDHPVYTDSSAVGICQYVSIQAEPNIISWWYNTDKVSQAEYDGVKSFFDLLDPKFKGQIVIGDVASSEANRDAVSMWQTVGKDWWDKLLTDMNVHVVAYGDERTYADGLINGDWSIGLFPPGSGSLEDGQAAGLPVAIWENTMSEGNPRSGIQRICVYKDRPHPNAAQLFVNWSLMKSGQTAFNQFTNRVDRASLRDDVPQGNIADDLWARARDKTKLFIDDTGTDWLNYVAEFNTYIKAKYEELGIVPGS
jgi:iron(III) transport system substrate-binding protein